MKGPEIQEALHGLPLHQRLVSSLHGCRYAEFFEALAAVEQSMKRTRVVAIHTRFYVRELRIKAYQQLLQSYQRCVTVVVMQVVEIIQDLMLVLMGILKLKIMMLIRILY